MKTINSIGWAGLLFMLVVCFTSCKKEELKEMEPAPEATSFTTVTFVEDTPTTGGGTSDTIRVYEIGGVTYMNTWLGWDTVSCTITATELIIPEQIWDCGQLGRTIQGHGIITGSNLIMEYDSNDVPSGALPDKTITYYKL